MGVVTGWLSPYKLLFQPKITEPWRFLNVFWSPNVRPDFHYILHAFFVVSCSSSLEMNAYNGRRADFLWMFIMISGALYVIGYVWGFQLLAGSFQLALIYNWSRRNRDVRLRLFLFTIKAPYLPWAMLIYSFLQNGLEWRPFFAPIFRNICWACLLLL